MEPAMYKTSSGVWEKAPKMLFEAHALEHWIHPAVHILLYQTREKPDWAVAVWALCIYRSLSVKYTQFLLLC